MLSRELNLGRMVVRYRWWIILVSVLMILFVSSGGRFIKFDNDERVYFSEDNPQLQAYEEIEKTYTKNYNIFFVLAPQGGDIFNRDVLIAVAELTEKAWKIPNANRVDSLSNFQYTYSTGDDFIIEDLIDNAPDLSDADIVRIKEIALSEPVLLNNIVSTQGHVTGINVNVLNPGKHEAEVNHAAQHARVIKQEIEEKYPDVKVYLNGGLMFGNAFQEVAREDMSTLVPLMYGIILFLILFLLRTVSGTFATLIIIGASTLTAMGMSGWLGISLNATSVNAPTIILTLAVADCVHVLVTMIMSMRKGMSKHEAISESLRVNTQPIVLTSVTTAIGFLCMNFSDAPPFGDLGNIVAVGVLAAMVFSLVLLPALMAVLPLKVRVTNADEESLTDRLSENIIRHRRPLLMGNLLIISIAVLGIANIELDDNFIGYFDQRYEIRQAADFTQQNLTGLDIIEYSLKSEGSGGINDPHYLQTVEAFANWYREQDNVTHVKVITDTIKRINQNMHEDDPAYYRIPDDPDLAAQNMLLYEMSLPYGLDLNNQINIDKSATRMVVIFANSSAKQLREMDEHARAWLQRHAPPSMFTYGSSLSLMFAHISERNVKQMLGGTLLALILISILLMIALRSVKLGLISLVPNLVPACVAFGVWGVFVGEVGLAIAVVGSMTLGVIVDDTVHFLSKYRRAREQYKLNSEEAVQYSFATVGRALMMTTLVLVVGFCVLTFSGFKINADMGLLAALAIAFALIIDFLFLPPLLLAMDSGRRSSSIVKRILSKDFSPHEESKIREKAIV